MINYIDDLPFPNHLIPSKLKELLSPIDASPLNNIEVACSYEITSPSVLSREIRYDMTTVTVPLDKINNMPLLYLNHGVVSTGPDNDSEGMCDGNYTIGGYHSLISSWGNDSIFTYNLSDRFWMTLGLTPRCHNNDTMSWDDISNDEVDIAFGELSTEYSYGLKRNVSWKIRNDYLRKYLWHLGHAAVRVFYYEHDFPRTKELEEIIGENGYFKDIDNNKWYDFRLFVHPGFPDKICLQVDASVVVALPELCPEKTLEDIIWPDLQRSITRFQARAMSLSDRAYFSDNLLKHFEDKKDYTIIPTSGYICYKDVWAFRDCTRVKRNYISMPYCKIFEGMDVRTIVTLSRFAVSKKEVDAAEDCENIAAKTTRFKDEFLLFGDNLSEILYILTSKSIPAEDIIRISKKNLDYYGWFSDEKLFRMAKVAPLNMSKDDFLSRCKTVNELFNQIPIGPLRDIILSTSISSSQIKNFGSIKLIHGIKNILDYLVSNHLKISDFKDYPNELKLKEENPSTLGLFILNDLRQIDAHDKSNNPLDDMEKLGFDRSICRQGYGKALDFMYDKIIDFLYEFNQQCNFLFGNDIK
uniref:Uncharacterized protein n=1 Tax=uncultured Alphaproteobacteria bacterium TaxID=91750 RepID=A0A6G8F2B6_9PROT|nr:hypothetical protein PlAlph_2990 [uncultured Alphaproteobacteria bacterium]